MSNYLFFQQLGKGGFGEVWLAQSTVTGETVAVKFLHNLDPEAVKRFRREIRLLSEEINNRFVVDVLDYNLATDQPYFVMEYCAGGSLRERVGKFRWKEAAEVLSHTVQALRSVHRKGGYHRDIKPDNILLAHDAESGERLFKLSDFGLGRTPHNNSTAMTNSPCGTTGYIAPEVLLGHGYSPAADIYSLGVTIIELITGQKNSHIAYHAGGSPLAFTNLLNKMTDNHAAQRPHLLHIVRVLDKLLNAPKRSPQMMAATLMTSPSRPQVGDWLVLGAGALGLLALLAGGEDKKWDAQVGRYRRADGRFAS